jgi:exopolyphosphatase/pppGpp-phosphohydrolase
VVDIGGGSVGISDVRESFFRAGASVTLGALALTDQFAESDPVAGEKHHRIASEIARQLDTVAWLPEKRDERLIRIMIYCWTMTMRCFSST